MKTTEKIIKEIIQINNEKKTGERLNEIELELAYKNALELNHIDKFAFIEKFGIIL